MVFVLQSPAGLGSVSVWAGNMSVTADTMFTYDEALTPLITGLSPLSTAVIGELPFFTPLNSWDLFSWSFGKCALFSQYYDSQTILNCFDSCVHKA